MRSQKIIMLWLALVIVTIFSQIILGGYVRLTRSGLSMYDWHVVRGVIPPLTEEAWQEAFANYQKTPEYRKINVNMDLKGYKEIFWREFNHRILGRVSGLLFVIPLFLFIFTGRLPWRENKLLLGAGILFAAQGVMGWYMVKSGLVNDPHVSPYRLAAHFWLALIILALIVWRALSILCGTGPVHRGLFQDKTGRSWLLFSVLLAIQITWGAFMAGLKAGHVSNTWPLMFGYWLPPNLLSGTGGFWHQWVANSVTVHFIHRWLAFAVLGAAGLLAWSVRRIPRVEIPLKRGATVLFGMVGLQITLGIWVIWANVAIPPALLHQGFGVVVFIMTVFVLQRMAATSLPTDMPYLAGKA